VLVSEEIGTALWLLSKNRPIRRIMKVYKRDRFKSGFTLIELLIVLAILAILAGFFFPTVDRTPHKAARIRCVNNLKQVGLSFRLYAGENRDRYPMNISTNNELIVNEGTPIYRYFQLLQKGLGTPNVVICPSDKEGKVANNFANFGNSNVSYFIGLDANEMNPLSILSGDRNITNGVSPRDSILDLTTNQMVGFTDEIHLRQGNVALGDGSVQQVSSSRLRSEIIANTGFATNRILLP
jgi:prepilin-type N-terminal cleavage/methylation domain-containing protein